MTETPADDLALKNAKDGSIELSLANNSPETKSAG